MIEKKQRPIMSQDVINSGKSFRGYLNEQEFVEAVAKNYKKWAGLGFGIGVIIAIVESFTMNYSGPYAPLLMALLGVVTAYVKTIKAGQSYIEEGDEIDSR